MKHTPGPWFAIGSAQAGDEVLVVTSSGSVVAVPGEPAFDTKPIEANARLIAAAPDLLEAVYGVDYLYAELQAALPDTVKTGSFKRVTEAVDKARAAIEKATREPAAVA